MDGEEERVTEVVDGMWGGGERGGKKRRECSN